MQPPNLRLHNLTGPFRRVYWGLIPLLALFAYATTLRIGFLSDDFLLLYTARQGGLDPAVWLPNPDWLFYRPVGTFFTWQLGWQLWGFNPFPYHLMGLLMHATASLLLGLWLATATSNRTLGWLAGALFAVFPLDTEAVGWVAAQWDVLATLFTLLALWLFTLWYRESRDRQNWYFYTLSLLSYTLAVFTKESVLAFLPVFAFSAWLVKGGMSRRDWGRLLLTLLPFCVPLLLNITLRLATWSNLGGYSDLKSAYSEQFWDGFLDRLHMLLAPVSPVLLGGLTSQLVGALSSLGILAGLALYGRQNRHLLLVAGAWVLFAALPALNLPVKLTDLENNRYLYLAAGGHCAGIATLLYSLSLSLQRWKLPLISAFSVLLALLIAATWAQLRPWHTATVQSEAIEKELLDIIPAPLHPRHQAMVWSVQDPPDNYRGAYIFRQGLGGLRDFTRQDGPFVEVVSDASHVDLSHEIGDAYSLSFSYDPTEMQYHVAYGAGITGMGEPLAQPATAMDITWDFRTCGPEVLQSWQAISVQTTCVQGKGLSTHPTNGDPQLVLPALNPPLLANSARYMRVLLSPTYPVATHPDQMTAQWFWRGLATDWGSEQTRTLFIKRDGVPHTYWTLIPTSQSGDITGLRLDPVNGTEDSTIQWISVDLIGK